MSCAWKDDRCRIGMILGTGTNACYLEEIKDIHTIDKDKFAGQVRAKKPTQHSKFIRATA